MSIDINQIHKVSPSMMNKILETCPRQWKNNKLGLPQITCERKKTDFGIVVHNIIQVYFQEIGKQKPTKKQIKETVTKLFNQMFTLEGMIQKRNRVMKHFIEFEIRRLKTWETYAPELVEKKLVSKFYVAKLDFFGSGTYIDWKTGRLSTIGASQLNQSGITSIALKENNYEHKKTLFVYLDSGRTQQVPMVTESYINEKTKRILYMIKNDIFPARRCGLCYNYCPYLLLCELENVSLWEGVFGD